MALKDFADLKSLRNELKDQEQARALEKAEREQRERQVRQEANLFQSAVGGVKRLPQSDKVVRAPVARAPLTARELEDDNAAVLRESLSDQFDVEHLLEEDPNISFARHGVGPDVVRKLRKGHWPVQDELDLHGLRRDSARDAIGAFLRDATRNKLRCVCVIHGKGLSSKGGEPVLRSMVHSWLEQKEEVIAFCAARMDEKSHGALLVLLR
ncbi:MAG: Smr/MutS family protein [Pseudomonadota bacterium]